MVPSPSLSYVLCVGESLRSRDLRSKVFTTYSDGEYRVNGHGPLTFHIRRVYGYFLTSWSILTRDVLRWCHWIPLIDRDTVPPTGSTEVLGMEKSVSDSVFQTKEECCRNTESV